MRELHVTSEVLDRFARGDLDDADLSEFLDHFEKCETCARAGQNRTAQDLTVLRTGWASEPDVQFRPAPRPVLKPVYVWTLAAAAAFAIAFLSVLLLPRERPTPREPGRTIATPQPGRVVPVIPSKPAPPAAEERYHDPAWQRAVTRALGNGRLPFPKSLEELSGPEDTVRGGTGAEERIAPAGIIIDDIRPTFTWPARKGGTYTLFVFDEDREVMQSAPLQRPRWTPGRDLPRGRTLTWQVEVTGLEDFETIPSPPSPPARFRIVKEAEHRELVEARKRHPDDSLLLSVLYARSGLRAEALEALRRAAADDEAAKRILDHETSPVP